MEVKTTFLNVHLEERIYIIQPDGYIEGGHESKVCKFQQSIFGLKQASRSWNKRFDEVIKTYGFDQNFDELCVYKKIQDKIVIFLVLYVDDILFVGNDEGVLSSTKVWLVQQIHMNDLGEASYILGIQNLRDQKNKQITLSQDLFIDKILVRFSM